MPAQSLRTRNTASRGTTITAVDLAVIVVPRDAVSPVLNYCAGKGINSVIVISSGFAETGPEGSSHRTGSWKRSVNRACG